MSLTEIMSAAGLSRYAEVALVLFFLAFLVILWRIYAPSRKRALERASRIPLDDDNDPPSTHRGD